MLARGGEAYWYRTHRLPTMTSERVSRLRKLPTIREQCRKVLEVAKNDKLTYFEYHPEREPDVVKFCQQIIEVRVCYCICKSLLFLTSST